MKVDLNKEHETEIKESLRAKKGLIYQALEKYVSWEHKYPPRLLESMRYSLFSGGKRLRPILTLAAGEVVGGEEENLLPFACAIELIHTYSLIHDDLPSMDNDDYRRGRLTNHKVFGEAIAILTGDALLTLAFQIITDPALIKNFKPELLLKTINEITAAAGAEGMVGGQAVDILSVGSEVNKDEVNYIHEKKTGALIKASVWAGGFLGGGSKKKIEALSKYGEKIGLAFQIIDDILDIEGEKEVLGKDTDKDRDKNRATYPAIYGLEESKQKAAQLIEEAIKSLKIFGKKAYFLKDIASFILLRKS